MCISQYRKNAIICFVVIPAEAGKWLCMFAYDFPNTAVSIFTLTKY